eukprot:scaffold2894_cov195-Pinguiococcus_pyrenoidosus.AAC.2
MARTRQKSRGKPVPQPAARISRADAQRCRQGLPPHTTKAARRAAEAVKAREDLLASEAEACDQVEVAVVEVHEVPLAGVYANHMLSFLRLFWLDCCLHVHSLDSHQTTAGPKYFLHRLRVIVGSSSLEAEQEHRNGHSVRAQEVVELPLPSNMLLRRTFSENDWSPGKHALKSSKDLRASLAAKYAVMVRRTETKLPSHPLVLAFL